MYEPIQTAFMPNPLALQSFSKKQNFRKGPNKPLATLTKPMKRLLATISDKEPVQLVPTKEGATHECYFNVWNKVEQFGGKTAYGWLVYNFYGLGAELVPHAVWQRPDGELVDITAEEDGHPTVWFLPDTWEYTEFTATPTLEIPFPGRVTPTELLSWEIENGGKVYTSKDEFLELLEIMKPVRDKIIQQLSPQEHQRIRQNGGCGLAISSFQLGSLKYDDFQDWAIEQFRLTLRQRAA